MILYIFLSVKITESDVLNQLMANIDHNTKKTCEFNFDTLQNMKSESYFKVDYLSKYF